jgi:hypothetical protein
MRLLYFSPVPAASYAQRPHFMVRTWLEWGIESVLWVNPYPCRLPQWQDSRRRSGRGNQAMPLDPRIRVLDVPSLPIEPLPLGPWLNRRLFGHGAWREIERFADGEADIPVCRENGNHQGRQECLPHHKEYSPYYQENLPRDSENRDVIVGIGRPCALALAALRRLQPAVSFFDAMDNFPEFYRGLSRRSMRRCEDAVAAEVDLVVASSSFLADKFARRGLRVEKVLNACELNDECGSPQEESLHPSSHIPHPFPILGYLGCMGRWFDWPLVIGLAEAMPQSRIELVGPCVVPPPLRPPANVWLFPACRQSQVAGYLNRFSAGLIPFRDDALTAGVDPIKYYDYRAAGLPVLSTRFGEMAFRGRDDGVYLLDQSGGLAETVSAALADRRDDAEITRFRRDNNWTSRFLQSNVLRSLLPASRTRRAA